MAQSLEEMEALCERLGVAEVRAKLAAGRWPATSRLGRAAKGWLVKQDHADAARQAKLAAEAVKVARGSMRASTASAIVAVLALLVSLVALLRGV